METNEAKLVIKVPRNVYKNLDRYREMITAKIIVEDLSGASVRWSLGSKTKIEI